MTRRFIVEKGKLPNLAGMMLATLEALRTIGGSARIQELNEKVVELEGVSEEEQTHVMPGDANNFALDYYLSWARTFLKRGGALENSARGVWALTGKGAVTIKLEQAKAIYEQVLAEERERARQKRQSTKGDHSNKRSETEVEAATASFSTEVQQETDWKEKLSATISTVKPDAFERLAQRLLREAGFTKVEVRGKIWRWRNRWRRSSACEPGFFSSLFSMQTLEGKRRRQGYSRLPWRIAGSR